MINKGYRSSDDKTVAIHFHRKRGMEPAPRMTLNNNQIKFKTFTKFLGLIFNQKLIWNSHLEKVKEKATKTKSILKI